jgi:Zn finger protein HypA/HybF involved in hydrogenase expression
MLTIANFPIVHREPFHFRCPRCRAEIRPANVKCIVCANCGEGGNVEALSAVLRKAA